MGRRCCIKSCSNSKKPNDVIHVFPKSSSMKELWIGVVEKLNGCKLKVDVSNYGVCTQHFSPSDYSVVVVTKSKSSSSLGVSSGATRRLLLPSAVPSTRNRSSSQSFNQAPCCVEGDISNNLTLDENFTSSTSSSNSQIVSVTRVEFDGLVKSLKEERRQLSNRTNKWKFRMGTMKNQLKQLRSNCVLQQQMIADLQKITSAGGGIEEKLVNVVNPISLSMAEVEVGLEVEGQYNEEEEHADKELSKLQHCLLCNNRIPSILLPDNEAILFRPTTTTTNSSNNESPSVSETIEIKMEIDDVEGILNQNNSQRQYDHNDLISLLQTHFNIIITKMSDLSAKAHELDSTEDFDPRDIFQFCAPCHHQILTFKKLKAQILDLQRQGANLKHKIAYGLNNSFLLRRKEMSARRRAMISEQIDAKYAFIPSPMSDHRNSTSPANEDEEQLESESLMHFEEEYNLFKSGPSPSTNESNIEHNLTSSSSSVNIRPCSIVLDRIEVSETLKKPNDTLLKNPPKPPIIPKPKVKRVRTRKLDKRKGGPFICQFCSKSFTMKYKRNIHMRVHTGAQPYTCTYCHKKFHKADNLRVHVISVHTRVKSYFCEHCGNSFSFRKTYRLHLAKEHDVFIDGGPYQCSLCSEKFLWPSNLTKHVSYVHEGKPRPKKVQKKKLNEEINSEDLKQHSVICKTKKTKEAGFPCDLCGVSFENQRLLKAHRHKLHPKEEVHQCEHCGRICTTNEGLVKHVRVVHEGERRFQCRLCVERFAANSSLKQHIVHHTGEKLHKCNYCDNRFNKWISKKQHMVKDHPEIHLVQNPFVCPICYSIYSTEAERDEHVLQLHDKFKCKVCNKAFANGQRYKVHMRIHTGEKPFVCQFCSKAFNRGENLREHCYRHTGERPHKCKVQDCNQGFLRKKELTIHMEKVHFNNAESQEAETDHTVESSAVDENFIISNQSTSTSFIML